MNDKFFLQWLHGRLIHVYGEKDNIDFLHRLRNIINATPEHQNANGAINVNAKYGMKAIHDKAWQAFNQSKEPTAKGQLKDALEAIFND